MNDRCSNHKNVGYHLYGGRGIKVCARWGKFENFLADMGERPSKQHSIGRINANGNYEKFNCAWQLIRDQSRNKSNTRWITAFGKTQPLVAWAEEKGVKIHTIRARIERGWTPEKALSTPAAPWRGRTK